MNAERVRRVLVTGHDGYVGAVLCRHLVESGYDVVGLDTFYYRDCTFADGGEAVPALQKDVRDVNVDDLRGLDAVIHLAGLSNDPVGSLDPELTMAINHRASARLAAAARAAGVGRFLYASSCSLYGKAGEEWVDEGAPMAPLTAYAESKVRAEEDILRLAEGDFSPAVLRCSTVYGVSPKLRVDLVVNNLAGWGVTSGEIRILSDGSPWRPLIHVEDLARAYEFFLRLPAAEARGLVVNVGFDSQNYQVRDIAEAVREALPGARVAYAGTEERDSRSYRVRFAKFSDISGIKPGWDIGNGAHQLVASYREKGLTLEAFGGRKFTRLKQLRSLLDNGKLDVQLRWMGP